VHGEDKGKAEGSDDAQAGDGPGLDDHEALPFLRSWLVGDGYVRVGLSRGYG